MTLSHVHSICLCWLTKQVVPHQHWRGPIWTAKLWRPEAKMSEVKKYWKSYVILTKRFRHLFAQGIFSYKSVLNLLWFEITMNQNYYCMFFNMTYEQISLLLCWKILIFRNCTSRFFSKPSEKFAQHSRNCSILYTVHIYLLVLLFVKYNL